MLDVVEIKIWGELIGAARWDQNLELASFQCDKKFLARNYDLSPIKMPLQNRKQIYSFPELRKHKNKKTFTFKGLHRLLADTLPDKYSDQLINIWLVQKSRPPSSMNPGEQLYFIGFIGKGALEFEPRHLKSSQQIFIIEIKV
jgi:serine/threonine-protein kinase HipA